MNSSLRWVMQASLGLDRDPACRATPAERCAEVGHSQKLEIIQIPRGSTLVAARAALRARTV